MDREELTNRIEGTLDFLRTYCKLDEPIAKIVFEDPYYVEAFIHPLAKVYPHYRDDPFFYMPAHNGDNVLNKYNAVQEGLAEKTEKEFFEMVAEEIPDSEEYVVVDIGSHLGINFTLPLSRKKPNLRIYMVDCFDRKGLEDETNYVPKIDGKPLKKVPFSNDVGETVNLLLDENNYQNIKFVHKKLSVHVPERTDLPELEKILRTRKVVFLGKRNPALLSFATIFEGIYHDAIGIHYSPSALERTQKSAIHSSFIRNLFSLSDIEYKKYVELLLDPEGDLVNGKFKFDYNKKPQKRIGIMLKQLFVLVEINLLMNYGYDANLFLRNTSRIKSFYNNPDHLVMARREDRKKVI